MGKCRALKTKRIASLLLEKYGDKFTTDFEQNKRVIEEVTTIMSKPLRNRIAGWITKLLIAKNKPKTEGAGT
ncbi:MAG: 30S ribosomal protein S17e [Candidatus Bathyarchaeia archaeon]